MFTNSLIARCVFSLAAAVLSPLVVPAAQVTVTSASTAANPLTDYNFTITNNSLPTLLSVTLTTPAQANAVQNLTAPTGFSAFFDSGLGLVDFVSNGAPFTIGSAIGGFGFESSFQLGSTSFSALGLDSNENPVEVTGQVTPTGTSPTPEPATLWLLCVPLLLVMFLARGSVSDRRLLK